MCVCFFWNEFNGMININDSKASTHSNCIIQIKSFSTVFPREFVTQVIQSTVLCALFSFFFLFILLCGSFRICIKREPKFLFFAYYLTMKKKCFSLPREMEKRYIKEPKYMCRSTYEKIYSNCIIT